MQPRQVLILVLLIDHGNFSFGQFVDTEHLFYIVRIFSFTNMLSVISWRFSQIVLQFLHITAGVFETSKNDPCLLPDFESLDDFTDFVLRLNSNVPFENTFNVCISHLRDELLHGAT